jgi:hypothetical protein
MERLTDAEAKEWEALLARARMMLDDAGVEQERKRHDVARKQLARAGLEAPPVDLDAVKRTLIAYSRTKRYAISLEAGGASKDDMQIAYRLWPDAKTVCEFVQAMRNEQRSLDMEEAVDLASDKLKTLLRDDKGKCMVNPKLVMSTLEKLDRARFGEDSGGVKSGTADGDNEPLVYKVTNVQINVHNDNKLVADAFPSGGTVDVDAVVKALEAGDGQGD